MPNESVAFCHFQRHSQVEGKLTPQDKLTEKAAATRLTEEPVLNFDTKAFYSQALVVSPSAAKNPFSASSLRRPVGL